MEKGRGETDEGGRLGGESKWVSRFPLAARGVGACGRGIFFRHAARCPRRADLWVKVRPTAHSASVAKWCVDPPSVSLFSEFFL